MYFNTSDDDLLILIHLYVLCGFAVQFENLLTKIEFQINGLLLFSPTIKNYKHCPPLPRTLL